MNKLKQKLRISQLIALKATSALTCEEENELNEWINSSVYNAEEYDIILKSISKSDNYFYSMDMKSEWKSLQKRRNSKFKRISLTILKYAVVIILPISVFFITQNISPAKKQSPRISKVIDILPGETQGVLTLANGKKLKLTNNKQDTTYNVSGFIISKTKNTLVCSKKLEVASKIEKVEEKYNTLKIPKKGEYSLMLSDGTKVWLNSETELRFPEEFLGTNRNVFLKGEAYFDVAKDRSKPFYIHINNVLIEVLGTSFNVEARDNSNEIKATLVEGSILMNDNKSFLRISPNQQVIYNKLKSEITSKEVNVRKYISWKNGMFYFDNEELSVILEQLSRWYGVDIFYMNPSLKLLKFSVEVKRYENISKIIKMIEKTNKVKFEVKNNSIIVYK